MARTTRTPRAKRKSAARTLPPLKAAGANARQALETLMEQGARLKAEGGKLATRTVNQARETFAAQAEAAKSRATEAVGTLEKVFEQRVSQVITRLGVPTAAEVQALAKQVEQLQQSVERLRRARSRA